MKKIAMLFLTIMILIPYTIATGGTNDTQKVELRPNDEFKVIEQLNNTQKYTDYMIGNNKLPVSEDEISFKNETLLNGNGKFQVIDRVNGIVNIPEAGNITLEARAPKSARYQLMMNYLPSEERSANIEITVKINGNIPFKEANNIILYRKWKDDPSGRTSDKNGNDVRPPQIEERDWLNQTNIYEFALEQGINTISIGSAYQDINIREITLSPASEAPSYEAYLAKYAGKTDASTSIRVQAEKTSYKNDPTIVPVEDRSTPTTEPNKGSKISLNMIGGERWSKPGQEIGWKLNVTESGFYEIRIKSKQNYSKGFYSIRQLKLDGEVPFKEVENIQFKYANKWTMNVPGQDRKAYKFYLEKGEHTLSMTAVLGDFGAIFDQVNASISELNEVYRKLLMVLGTTPDTLRDYHIPQQLPDVMVKISQQRNILKQLYNNLVTKEGFSKGELEPLRKMTVVLDDFIERPYDIAARFGVFKGDIAAMSNWMTSVSACPLDIDYIDISQPGSPIPKADASWFQLLSYNLRMFTASFTGDFNVIEKYTDDEKPITVWIMTGREQAQVLNELINSTYTPVSNKKVNLQLVSQDSLLASVAAKNTADVVLGVGHGIPVDYALRNTLVDLSQFSDAKEVFGRFDESVMVPMRYKGGVYGLPETMSYPMMFYRKDILVELGMSPPQSWNDVIAILPTLQKNNLEFLIDTGVQMNSDVMGTYLMFLYQRGGELYRNEGMAIGIDSAEGIEAFKFWTDLYRNYGLPMNFNMANRFRTGESPLAITDFSMYNMLSIMAPEIKGLWGMVPVPGTIREDGSIDRSVGAAGNAAIMFSKAKDKEAAWDFIKWWSSAETQISFAQRIEAILGASARYPTANLEAMKKLQWSNEEFAQLMQQLKWVKGVPQVPGGYLVPRNISNAFRKVVISKSQAAREAVSMYTKVINNELTQKRKEFGLPIYEDEEGGKQAK